MAKALSLPEPKTLSLLLPNRKRQDLPEPIDYRTEITMKQVHSYLVL